jgi:hypothetical protein
MNSEQVLRNNLRFFFHIDPFSIRLAKKNCLIRLHYKSFETATDSKTLTLSCFRSSGKYLPVAVTQTPSRFRPVRNAPT